MRARILFKSLTAVILVSFLVFMTNTIMAEGAISACSSYDADEFVFCVDEANGDVYYSICNSLPLLRIKWTDVYRQTGEETTRIMTTSRSITSLYAHEKHLFYVEHDSFTWRGQLKVIPALEDGRRVILDETNGCGKILGMSGNSLYVETEHSIVSISMTDFEVSVVAYKHWYLSSSTTAGFTVNYQDTWLFHSWNTPSVAEEIKVTNERKNGTRVLAYSPDHFILFDKRNKTLFLYTTDGYHSYDRVISFCAAEHDLFMLKEQNGTYDVFIVDLSTGSPKSLSCSISLPNKSSIYVTGGLMYYVDEHWQMKKVQITEFMDSDAIR